MELRVEQKYVNYKGEIVTIVRVTEKMVSFMVGDSEKLQKLNHSNFSKRFKEYNEEPIDVSEMTKVWILERFINPEQMQRDLESTIETLEIEKAKEEREEAFIAALERIIIKHKKRIKETPEGYWMGWEGKISYNSFKRIAIEAISRDKRQKNNNKFRAVVALTKKGEKTWINYVNPTVNEAVTKYIYTMSDTSMRY